MPEKITAGFPSCGVPGNKKQRSKYWLHVIQLSWAVIAVGICWKTLRERLYTPQLLHSQLQHWNSIYQISRCPLMRLRWNPVNVDVQTQLFVGLSLQLLGLRWILQWHKLVICLPIYELGDKFILISFLNFLQGARKPNQWGSCLVHCGLSLCKVL